MKIQHNFTIWIFLSVPIEVLNVSLNLRDRLKQDVFAGYEADVRPYCNNNEAVTLTLDIAMRQLIEMNEPLQIIKANIWVRMKWTDCRLTWNASDYNGINNFIVPFDVLWVPDLTLYDNTGEKFFSKDEFRPNIFSDGTIYYNFPSVVENRCIVDITKFPYDSQTCKFVFGSWSFHGKEIDIVSKNSQGDLSSLEPNVEWEITSFPVERHVVYYNCCPQPYPDVTFNLVMTRKPGHYVTNILIPYFLITSMSTFGFFLPCETGEKVSLQITVMLSLAVFQMLLADTLPPSSETLPFIAIYFDFSMCLVAYATVIAIIVNNLHYRENHNIPKIVRILFFNAGSKIVFIKVPTYLHHDITQQFLTKSANTVSVEKETEKHQNNNNEASERSNNTKNESLDSILDGKYDKDAEKRNPTRLPPIAFPENHPRRRIQENDEEKLDEIEKTLKHIDDKISRSEEWKILSVIVDRLACYLFLITGIAGLITIFTLLKN